MKSAHSAQAQQQIALIGFLVSGAAPSFAIFVDAFKEGMRENGLIGGAELVIAGRDPAELFQLIEEPLGESC